MAMTFDGNTIQSSTFVLTEIDHYSLPTKDAPLFPLAFANKSSIPWTNYPNKGIRVTGYIFCDTNDSLEGKIDLFKSYLTSQDANLDIDYDGGTRRYIATVNRCDIKKSISSKAATFTLEFICTQPFGVATTPTELVDELAYTSSSDTYPLTIEGTAPYQYPLITITINTLTGTGDYVQISNDNNGQEMLIYGVGLVNGDVVYIDTFNRLVTVNGDPVDYLGTFLELERGSQSITYTDGFTTRSVDIYIEYYKRYL